MSLWSDIARAVRPPLAIGELVESLSLGDDGMWIVRSPRAWGESERTGWVELGAPSDDDSKPGSQWSRPDAHDLGYLGQFRHCTTELERAVRSRALSGREISPCGSARRRLGPSAS